MVLQPYLRSWLWNRYCVESIVAVVAAVDVAITVVAVVNPPVAESKSISTCSAVVGAVDERIRRL